MQPANPEKLRASLKAAQALRYGLAAAGALICLFWAPYHLAVTPSVSDSYLFGYNNHAGLAIILASLFFLGLWAWRAGWNVSLISGESRVSRRVLWAVLAIAAGGCLVVYLLAAPQPAYGEAAYFINRMELAGRGLRPYYDFEFAYGVGLIYGPLAFARTFRLSPTSGYYAFWAASEVVGLWLLGQTIDRIEIPSRRKTALFVMFGAVALVGELAAGVNYTWLRFILPAFFAVLLSNAMGRTGGWAARRGVPAVCARAAVVAVLAVACLLLVSPELALTFAVGATAYIPLHCLWLQLPRPGCLWLAPWGCMVAALAAELGLANRLGVFLTLREFAGGGFNFPILPAPAILFTLAAAGAGVAFLASLLKNRESRNNAVCIACVSAPQLPAAFGRCDPGHLVYYAFGMIVIGMLAVSARRRVWRTSAALFVMIFPVFGMSGLWLSRVPLEHAAFSAAVRMGGGSGLLRRAGERVARLQFGAGNADEKIANALIIPDARSDSAALPPHLEGIAEAPFGYTAVHASPAIDTGYYFGMDNVLVPSAVARKVGELEAHPDRELVIPGELAGAGCQVDVAAERGLIGTLLVYPFRGKAIHPQSVAEPLCAFIAAHYRLVAASQPGTFGYSVWQARATATGGD